MVGFGEIKVLKVFGKDNEGVADEEVGEVGSKEGVHTSFDEAGMESGVNYKVRVVVLGPEAGVFGYVGGVGGVAGFGNAPAIVCQRLLDVNAVGDDVLGVLTSSPSSSAVRSSTARLIWFHRTSVSTRKPL